MSTKGGGIRGVTRMPLIVSRVLRKSDRPIHDKDDDDDRNDKSSNHSKIPCCRRTIAGAAIVEPDLCRMLSFLLLLTMMMSWFPFQPVWASACPFIHGHPSEGGRSNTNTSPSLNLDGITELPPSPSRGSFGEHKTDTGAHLRENKFPTQMFAPFCEIAARRIESANQIIEWKERKLYVGDQLLFTSFGMSFSRSTKVGARHRGG